MTESAAPKNVRISVKGNEACEALVSMGLFSTALEAYRAAMGVALALDLPPVEDLKLELNKWDAGSVFRDPSCSMEPLLALMGVPESERVTRGMQLAESGLKYLNEKRLANVPLLPVLTGRKSTSGG